MPLNANNIVSDVADALTDPNHVTWSVSDLVAKLNAAVRQLAVVRPGAFAVTESVALTAGTKQTLPAKGLRLLDVVRNMGAEGQTPGPAITRTDRESLDTFNRSWHALDPADDVDNFTYDDRNPKVFYVVPPANAGRYIELVYAKLPADVDSADIAAGTQVTLDLDEVYEFPIQAWMLFLAFGDETSSPTSLSRSRAFEQSFYNALGIKVRADRGASPHVAAPLKGEGTNGEGLIQ